MTGPVEGTGFLKNRAKLLGRRAAGGVLNVTSRTGVVGVPIGVATNVTAESLYFVPESRKNVSSGRRLSRNSDDLN